MTFPIHCIAIQPVGDIAEGSVEWFYDPKARDTTMRELLSNPRHIGTVFTTFDIQVLDENRGNPAYLHSLVDNLAIDGGYTPIERRKLVLATISV